MRGCLIVLLLLGILMVLVGGPAKALVVGFFATLGFLFQALIVLFLLIVIVVIVLMAWSSR